MPTFDKGQPAYLAIGTAASETNISTYLNDISPSRGIGKEDTTTFGGSGWEESQGTIKNGGYSFSGLWNAALDAILRPLLFVEGKSIIYGPAGSGSGKPKQSALGYLSKFDVKPPVKGIVQFSGEFTVSGAITDGTFA